MFEVPNWILLSWSLLLTVAMAAIGFIVQRSFNQQDAIQKDIDHVKDTRVKTDDFNRALDRILDSQVRLESKLDTIAADLHRIK